MNSPLASDWQKFLQPEIDAEYFKKLQQTIKRAYQNTTAYPPEQLVFNGFNNCPLADCRVVIIGQDPYHGPGQAHGLAFSVPEETKIPPSLKNVYKEIESDLGTPVPTSGNLERWAKQGVLLLNATLTVEAGAAGSHQNLGWEQFTDAVIQKLSDEKNHLVFMLWGRYAKEKGAHIDRTKHLILEAAHPSPLSAYNGFFGCKHFSQANEYLTTHGMAPIVW